MVTAVYLFHFITVNGGLYRTECSTVGKELDL
uniref:Uncharacterized protein n=1 Tax=Anguilla anguilla TaxID=7936 RepID=A0A0E9UG50_ANGAN